MPWFPWPESIKKRACRYLLQHYLGQFLEEKLQLDQLGIDLYDGKGFVRDVLLDVYAINELLLQFHSPLEVVEGSAGCISISVPWSNLLQDNCTLEISGLNVTLQSRGDYHGAGNMTDSFYSSLQNMTASNMTTSMEIAQECFKDNEQKTRGPMFEGLEMFAQTIENVLSRIKVAFKDVNLRLEHCSRDVGLALQIHVDKIEYFDELSTTETLNDLQKNDTTQHFISSPISCKKFILTEILFTLHQFDLDSEKGRDFDQKSNASSEISNQDISSVPIVRCYGDHQLKVRVKQNGETPGPRVQVETSLGPCCVFLSPHQVNLLLLLLDGLLSHSSPGAESGRSKPLLSEDYQKIEEILSTEKNSDPVFEADQFFSMTDSVCPESIRFTEHGSRTSEHGSSSSGHSLATVTELAPRLLHRRQSLSAPDTGEKHIQFQVKVGLFILTLLHVDPIVPSRSYDREEGSNVDGDANVTFHERLSTRFFETARCAANRVDEAVFAQACDKRDHLRLVAATLHADCNRKMSDSATETEVTASLGSAEVVEVLTSDPVTSVLLGFEGNSPAMRLKVSRAEEKGADSTSVHLHLSECRSEVDISIVDRLSTLINISQLNRQPVLSGSLVGPLINDVQHRQQVFQQVLDDVDLVAASKLDVVVSCSLLHVDFRFPIPDLRDDLHCRPWYQRRLRAEVVTLLCSDIECTTSLEQSGHQEAAKSGLREITVQMEELKSLYNDEEGSPPKMFLHSASLEEEIIGKQNDLISNIFIQVKTAAPDANDPFQAPLPAGMDQTWFEMGEAPGESPPTPFSRRRTVYDSEEVVMPGDSKELSCFTEYATSMAKVAVTLRFPQVQLFVPSKLFLESFYNRVNNDLLLWQPSAPQPNNDCAGDYRVQLEQTRSHDDDNGALFSQGSEKGFLMESFDSDDITTIPDQCAAARTKVARRSLVAVALVINRCSLCLQSELERQPAQIIVQFENGSLFSVTSYEGNPNLDFISAQIQLLSLHHVTDMEFKSSEHEIPSFRLACSHGNPILSESHSGVQFNSAKTKSIPMLTLAAKIEIEDKRPLKNCLFSVLLNGTTLQHQFEPDGGTWLDQIVDMLDLRDCEVLGYTAPSFMTELHLHMQDCAVDYLPRYLQPKLRMVATFHLFSLSSNIVAASTVSVFGIIVDDAALFLSNSCVDGDTEIELLKNFVCVLEVGLLEINFKLKKTGNSNSETTLTDFSLRNNRVIVRTCADSCSALTSLLTYVADNRDLTTPETFDLPPSGDVIAGDDVIDCCDVIDGCRGNDSSEVGERKSPQKVADLLKREKEEKRESLSDLMADAMKDDHELEESALSGFKLSDFDETPPDFFEKSPGRDDPRYRDDDEFCIIVDGNDEVVGNEPTVTYLCSPERVVVDDNHFKPVVGRLDQLGAPGSFPKPVTKFTIKELSCSWFMFGGSDFTPPGGHSDRFDATTRGSSPHSRRRGGGPGRDHKTLVELHLKKIRFQHESYRDDADIASHSVFILTSVEAFDRLDASRINKLLYRFYSESSPKQAHAAMAFVKLARFRPKRSSLNAPECKLRVSMQPLRINVDQDTLKFVTTFCSTLAASVTSSDPGVTSKCEVTGSNYSGGGLEKSAEVAFQQPVFFREFIFSPEVPIWLDYHGKHIDTEQGTLAGLLLGLGQLNCSQLKLRKIVHRQGLLGVERVVNFALNEWVSDIQRNQLPSILGGVGPLHSVRQFLQGVRDLVWLPVEQYRRDGRIVRGLQRGTSSFGTSTTMAALELTNRVVWLIQAAAETTLDIVSPADNRARRERKRTEGRRQPSDFREGVNNAVTLVRHGVADTAYSIARVAQEEHEQRGLTGAVGGVLRQLPPTLVRPLVIASEATSNVLSGMRNQILPDAKREEDEKWRSDRP